MLTTPFPPGGLYWGLTALQMLGSPETLPREEVIEFVLSCQHPNGGFGSHPQYDPHLLYTLSAVQILFMEDALDWIDIDKVASCMCLFLFSLFSMHSLTQYYHGSSRGVTSAGGRLVPRRPVWRD